MSRRARVAALTAALAAAATATGGAGARAGLVLYGYPYARACPLAGIADVVDRWGMYSCNCTSYVAWALQANRQRIDWFVPGEMNAWNWPNVARRAGLTVDRLPAVGAVAVWPKFFPPYGHVAYVARVEVDGRIDVAEYNDTTAGAQYVFDRRFDVPTAGAYFIHVPRDELSDRG